MLMSSSAKVGYKVVRHSNSKLSLRRSMQCAQVCACAALTREVAVLSYGLLNAQVHKLITSFNAMIPVSAPSARC